MISLKKKSIRLICCFIPSAVLLSTAQVFATSETDVENAIAASGRDHVAGSIFIWFLCAVAFLKISQKIDSFMSSLGINVGRTGGNLLAELMVAGRAIGSAVRSFGGGSTAGNTQSGARSASARQAAGQNITVGGSGLAGIAYRAFGNAAASNATGRSSGLASAFGGAVFASSMKNGGRFATDVISSIATGSIASTGSITGSQASEALRSYLGYGNATGVHIGSGTSSTATGGVSASTADDVITADGGMSAAAAHAAGTGSRVPGNSIPTGSPSFRDVEIGGGRITGYETQAGGGNERRFAMYNSAQYLEPSGSFEKVATVDGQNWYKQYAEPVIEKEPYEDESGKISYEERVVERMPPIPKRKDKV